VSLITKPIDENDSASQASAGRPHRGMVVCGWYTPDYAHWADRLIASLDVASVRHDIVAVAKQPGGWERNTCRKAWHLLAAMDRHPGEVIVFLDVDCVVRGDLSELASAGGDIAFRLAAKVKRGVARMQPRSGTLVVQPTAAARACVETWARLSREASYGETDESTLSRTMAESHGATFAVLAQHWCAMGGSDAENAIIHDTASASTPKAWKLGRIMAHAASFLARRQV
jgi:hypothetical protein